VIEIQPEHRRQLVGQPRLVRDQAAAQRSGGVVGFGPGDEGVVEDCHIAAWLDAGAPPSGLAPA
jgi:hypothetical protein